MNRDRLIESVELARAAARVDWHTTVRHVAMVAGRDREALIHDAHRHARRYHLCGALIAWLEQGGDVAGWPATGEVAGQLRRDALRWARDYAGAARA